MATTLEYSPRCMAGMTFRRAMDAVLRTPQRSFLGMAVMIKERREKENFVYEFSGLDQLAPDHRALPAAAPEAQDHWKLKPPRWPVTSTTSPMKNRPGTLLVSIVLAESSLVSTPPAVTSAFS